MRTYLNRWNNLMIRAGCINDPLEQYHNLIKVYSEKHRAYHNFNHIRHCLEEFDQVRDQLIFPDSVEIAIWYHDAVYNTRSAENEQESALLAEKELNRIGIQKESIKIICDLILFTRHNETPEEKDAQFLLDADLSILGALPDKYQTYERNIRYEYEWVPKSAFRIKRFEILESFLCRESIFYTEHFKRKYEKQARFNIRSVLNQS